MMHYFGAGPTKMPNEVLLEIKETFLEWKDKLSILEISHKSEAFLSSLKNIQKQLTEILKIPDTHTILLMHGGARAQFSAVPLNLLAPHSSALYVCTGYWSKQAALEGSKFGNTISYMVDLNRSIQDLKYPDDRFSYVHYTDNETIDGIEFISTPSLGEQRYIHVVDATSNILTRPVDFEKISVLYASSQKNLGIAGLCVVIIRKDLPLVSSSAIPLILDYELWKNTDSLCNTPATFAWYVLSLMLAWVQRQGGISFIEKSSLIKSSKLYRHISYNGFYRSNIPKNWRSRMNVVFDLPDVETEMLFLTLAEKNGFYGLKGHAVRGGVRASLYPSIPEESVEYLASFMKWFEGKYG